MVTSLNKAIVLWKIQCKFSAGLYQPGHRHFNTNVFSIDTSKVNEPSLPSSPLTLQVNSVCGLAGKMGSIYVSFSLVCIVLSRLFPSNSSTAAAAARLGPWLWLINLLLWVQWLSCPLPGTEASLQEEMKLGRRAAAAGRVLPRLSRCRASWSGVRAPAYRVWQTSLSLSVSSPFHFRSFSSTHTMNLFFNASFFCFFIGPSLSPASQGMLVSFWDAAKISTPSPSGFVWRK